MPKTVVAAALGLLMLALVGCAAQHEPDDPSIVVVRDGISEPITIDLPEGASAVLVVIDGHDDALYGLASLIFADGVEHGTDIAFDETMRTVGGGWAGEGPDRQVLRLGTFAFQYPMLASEPVPRGTVTVRVASDRDGPARVHVVATIAAPRVLHVSLVSFTDSMRVERAEPGFITGATELLARAGIELVIDERVDGDSRAALPRSDSFPRPGDPSDAIDRAARALLHTDALAVVLMEWEDDFAFGLALGRPIAPALLGHYNCVIVDATPSAEATSEPDRWLSRVLAHELGHALGLPHPQDTGLDGERLLDPFDDTTDAEETVMGSVLLGAPLPPSSLRFSPQQVFAMQRSALLD